MSQSCATSASARLLLRLQEAIVAPDQGATLKRVDRWLTRGPDLNAQARLQVYRRSYLARLEECLADDYPALRHALGAGPFARLSRDYVEHNPPRERSLNQYGSQLSSYCERRFEHAPLGKFAGEMAALEWMLVEAVHAADTPAEPFRSLRTLTELGACRLVFNPSLRVRAFSYPVADFYRCWVSGGPSSVPEPASPSHVAVWRSGYRVLRASLTAPGFSLLEALLAGESVAAAVERLAAASGPLSSVGAEEVRTWFCSWVADGFIAGII
jgi:hypothetical protein